ETLELRIADAAGFAFELDCENAPVMNREKIGQPSHPAERFHDRALALSAEERARGAMKPEQIWHPASFQVRDNGAVICLLKPAGHGRPSCAARSASRARVRFIMSESLPSVRFSRYMPGNAVSGTMAT